MLAFEPLHAVLDLALEVLHQVLQLGFNLRWVGHALGGGGVCGPRPQFDLHFHFLTVSDDDGRDDSAWLHARDGG